MTIAFAETVVTSLRVRNDFGVAGEIGEAAKSEAAESTAMLDRWYQADTDGKRMREVAKLTPRL
jgi:hypothetical protein